jgi:hypothetical protein
MPPFDQEHAGVVDDHGTNADQWTIWVFSLHASSWLRF